MQAGGHRFDPGILHEQNVNKYSANARMITEGFEWDSEKAASNVRLHGVTFDEASSVFSDRFAITVYDVRHSEGEDRYVTFGISGLGRIVAVMHTERGENLRLISARKATRRESKAYEENRTKLSR